MKKILATVIALGVMAPLAAQAENWYGTVSAGAAWLSDSDFTISDPFGSITGETEFDVGYLVNGGIGYKFGNIRAEGVIQYQDNDIDTMSFFGVDIPVDGDISSLAFMVNGYYDFDMGSPFVPFITGGIGWAQVEANDVVIAGIPAVDSDDSVFAWQIGLGVGYALNAQASLDLAYRYFATSDPEFDVIGGGTVETEVGSHNFSLGLRYNF
jgi:opacity protein-like surface antigen